MARESALVFLVLHGIMLTVESREFCEAGPTPKDDYFCDVGHCCGDGECCTYYYELWWFWLVWFLIVFVIGFCVWQRKKFHPWREHQVYRNHCGLCGPPDLYPDILPIPPVKLPSYAEIGETASFNTPPPPYTCECYMPAMSTSSVVSFDQPPPEIGAPPRYMPYPHMIAPLLPRMNSTTSSMGTQFPEGGTSSSEQSPVEGPVVHSPRHQEPLVQSPTQQSPSQQPPTQQSPSQQPPTPQPSTPGSPCLSCSSPSTPLTASRSCSCSSVQGTSGQQPPQTVNTRGGPGLAFPVGLGTNLYFRPAWYGGSFGKADAHRAQVPFIRGANFNPCPRCVSRSSSYLGQVVSAPSTMRDASTSTLSSAAPPPLQNQDPDRYERRNSYSLPRNFVCSTKRPT